MFSCFWIHCVTDGLCVLFRVELARQRHIHQNQTSGLLFTIGQNRIHCCTNGEMTKPCPLSVSGSVWVCLLLRPLLRAQHRSSKSSFKSAPTQQAQRHRSRSRSRHRDVLRKLTPKSQSNQANNTYCTFHDLLEIHSSVRRGRACIVTYLFTSYLPRSHRDTIVGSSRSSMYRYISVHFLTLD